VYGAEYRSITQTGKIGTVRASFLLNATPVKKGLHRQCGRHSRTIDVILAKSFSCNELTRRIGGSAGQFGALENRISEKTDPRGQRTKNNQRKGMLHVE
jgi:hypothetical protein